VSRPTAARMPTYDIVSHNPFLRAVFLCASQSFRSDEFEAMLAVNGAGAFESASSRQAPTPVLMIILFGATGSESDQSRDISMGRPREARLRVL
jgi:hypothetical protein